MKHVFAIVFVLFGVAVFSEQADAQIILCGYCCDAYGNARCAMVNEVPCGNTCFCVGQGYGNAC
jgi:hypothetical protein